MTPQHSSTEPITKRPWFRFGLRTLLILTSLAGIGLGWLPYNMRLADREAKAIEVLKDQRGFSVSTFNRKLSLPARCLSKWFGKPLFPTVTELSLEYDFTDAHDSTIGPISNLRRLRSLNLNLEFRKIDLNCLRGLPIEKLTLGTRTRFKNVDALRGLPLKHLEIHRELKQVDFLRGKTDMTLLSIPRTNVPNLEVLRGMELTKLSIAGTESSSLEALRGMPLRSLHLKECSQILSLEVLRGMPLNELELEHCYQIQSLEALNNSRIERLVLHGGRFKEIALEGINLKRFCLRGCDELTRLAAGTGVFVKEMDVTASLKLSVIEGFEGVGLKKIHISTCPLLLDLDGLKNNKFDEAHVAGCGISNLEFLSQSDTLEHVRIRDCGSLSNLPKLKHVKFLEITNIPFKDLASLKGLKGLTRIAINKCGYLESIDGLQADRIDRVFITNCRSLKSLTGFKGVKSIGQLTIKNCPKLQSLQGLEETSLFDIEAAGNYLLNDLTALSEMDSLQRILIKNCRTLKDVSPILDLPNLKMRWIWGCADVENIDEIQISPWD